METENSVILDTCESDSVLLQTVKNIVNQDQHNEIEPGEEEFFLVTDVENEHQRNMNISNEESICNLNESLERMSLSRLCRTCAKVYDHFVPIFEGEGMEYSICDKIHRYLPIHISENDTLPLNLCYHCAAMLLTWHGFIERCMNAERKLLEIQNSFENKQYFQPQSTYESEILPEMNLPNVTDKNFPSQENEVKNEAHKEEAANYLSRSSGNRTTFKMFLEMHNIFWKPYKKRCQLQQKKSNAGGDCNSVWIAVMDTTLDHHSSISDLQQNNDVEVKKEISEEYKQNNATIMDREENTCMVTFLPNVNSESQKTKMCKTSLNDTKDSNEQIKKQKTYSDIQESYQCIECGKFFKLKDSYLRHMRIHKDERPFTCHVCGKQFRDSGGLSRHLKDVHAKLKNFTCDICGNSFASKATRDDHRRTHTGERPYICDSCGKTFKSKASLYIHSKLHTDEFPHPCSYCNKKFRRRQEMLAHVTTHTGEKNYGCDICSKRFRVKSELVRHKLVHSETKPFVCVKCGLAFRQKRYLNYHIKSRHVDLLQME
ncbi:PREDICTED: zinc finger protein 470-like [Polistes canadensis]|uniref:zinc finger protein 470-like n=1 Tax=Polistes canadensis TaxID=91411 RepID=UPI000718ED40|nr:PREDICTED: zinc finger protein 470-like [Polistes canadensis]XP_014616593.1 PREDICTED: zinc finger protein 470-like [Polistes canadensis]